MLQSTTPMHAPGQFRVQLQGAKQARNLDRALLAARALIDHSQATRQDLVDCATFAIDALDYETALMAYRRAHRREPESVTLLIQLAEFEHFCGCTGDALMHLDEAFARCDKAPEHLRVGATYTRFGEAERALTVFERAARRFPGDGKVSENLAYCLAHFGRIDEAEALYDQVVTRGRAEEMTFFNRSWLRPQTTKKNHVDELSTVLARLPGSEPVAPFIHYALAKELEDLGDFEKSFEHLAIASRQRRRQVTYSIDADVRQLNRMADTFGQDYFAKVEGGYPSAEPVFIVGMPRSGSTLTERFLANHSQVFAAGELQNFDNMVRLRMAEEAVGSGTYRILDHHDHFRRIDMNKVGETYVASTRPRTGHTPRFIDKNPNNFLNVGAIAVALPRAKIICVERDPMDSCYAMYKQAFRNAFDFSYDMTELAQYYAAYQRLMAHWEDVLPGRVVRLRYEDLVRDTETAVRKLVSDVGLHWEDGCLNHQANGAATMTPSAVQVRQPIYTSSIGKWRHVERHLEPLRAALEEQGIKSG